MSSISSRSLSMSSLIFLPFLASSGLALPPSPPPSAGFVGRVSFLFCSAILPSIGLAPVVHAHQGDNYPRILACRIDANGRLPPRPPELLAEGEGLVLVGRAEPDPVEAIGPVGDALEP